MQLTVCPVVSIPTHQEVDPSWKSSGSQQGRRWPLLDQTTCCKVTSKNALEHCPSCYTNNTFHNTVEIGKGIRNRRPLIRLQKTDLIFFLTKASANIILKEEYYKQLVSKLENEFEFTLKECKARFGSEATKEVIQCAKIVPFYFLKRKLQSISKTKKERIAYSLKTKNTQKG